MQPKRINAVFGIFASCPCSFRVCWFLYFVGLFRSHSWHYLLKAAGVGSYGDLRRAVQTQLQQKFRRAGDGGHSRGMLWPCFFLYVLMCFGSRVFSTGPLEVEPMLEVKLCTVGTWKALPNRSRWGCLMWKIHSTSCEYCSSSICIIPRCVFIQNFVVVKISSQLHDVWYRESLQIQQKTSGWWNVKQFSPRTCGERVTCTGSSVPFDLEREAYVILFQWFLLDPTHAQLFLLSDD